MVLDHLADRFQRTRRWLTATTVAMEANDQGVIALRMVPSGTGQAPQITDCAVAALPEGFITAGVPQEPQALGHFIRDLLDEGDIPVRDVALDLPPPCCQARLLRLPETIPATALPQLVRKLGTEEGLPTALRQAQIATLPFSPQAATGEQSVLLIGCERATVAAWIQTMAAAGLSLRRLGWAQTTLLRALQGLQSLFGKLELVGLLDLQPGTSWLTLVLDGVPYTMTSLPGLPDGGFHGRLQQHLEGEEPDPEETLLPLNLQASHTLVWALIDAVETAQQRHGQAHMAQLYLVGPGSAYPRIAQQIAEQSGWPTALLDPMALLNVHHPLPPEVVVGSAMARLVTTAMEDL
ncbi:hypothetical protein [Candidatus Synechococcus spongiarum]|uniref:Type IV pilus biogenesis protein PilM n=1 Tax=Candidatus Synechococcus spongiarum TaxID=431041 RepID=A0A170T8G3_9SYNE|nr:hypothetical protein [Candidatus Synechococcus spongiarum]CZB17412.1 hypothetical protein FLM9_804 [Candidatus Synechococcus spongiarum]